MFTTDQERDIRLALSDLQVYGLTLWAEARNQGLAGIVAVGCAIRNRAAEPGWWGRTIRTVCLKPWQFSCWNPCEDPNHQRLLTLAVRLIRQVPTDDYPILADCLATAAALMADGTVADTVNGSNHYYNPAGMKPPGSCPKWALDPVTRQLRPPRVIVGDHRFYRLTLDGRMVP